MKMGSDDLESDSGLFSLKNTSNEINFCGEPQFIILGEGENEEGSGFVQVKVYNDDINLYMDFHLTDDDYKMENTSVTIEGVDYSEEDHLYIFSLAGLDPVVGISVSASLESTEPAGYVFTHLEELAGNLKDEDGLPGTVSIEVDYFSTTDSYFNTTIIEDNLGLEGNWEGWCVDLDRGIVSGVTYEDVKVYSSYDDPDTLKNVVDKPENLAKVNFILSRDYVGKESVICGETFSRSDVQRAVWALIDDGGTFDPEDENTLVVGGGLVAGEMSMCKVQEILDAANEYEGDFIPACSEDGDGTYSYRVAVILDPNTESATGQVTIGQVIVTDIVQPCELVPVYDHKLLVSGIEYTVQECPVPADCEIIPGAFRTQSMGGWGSRPAGNNPGAYLDANFDAVFGGGLVAGGRYTLTLTSAGAVRNFLPQGGRPAALGSDLVDPDVRAGSFAGDVVALKLSVGFDLADPDFGESSTSLKDLVFASGTFEGMTVEQVLALAEMVLGGDTGDYSLNELHGAVKSVNENFPDGKSITNPGLLVCPF